MKDQRVKARKRILIVDDDSDFTKVLQSRLQQRDYEVVVAGNGEGAVVMARTFHPDLILLDLGMPGLAGDITGLRIKVENGNRFVPIVALTGHGDFLSQATTRAMGFVDHILKPYDPEDLFRRIERLLSGATAADEPKETT